MAFRLSDALAKAVEGWGVDRTAAETKAEELAERYPDLAQFEEQFTGWLVTNTAEVTDLSTLTATLAGIARDVFSGVAGKDPRAHQGNV